MAGGRERLAKAVVLEALRAAHVADRPCIVYAFGAASELAELRLLTSRRRRRNRARDGGGDGSLAGIDRPALNRLLDFMGHAFGGGTDVASPLRRALATLEPGAGGDDAAYAGADIILVSDGELPSPPVDAPTMARLEAARRRSGVEVHGLLIGEARPTPLDEICDEVHTFLCEWDPLRLMRLQTEEAATKAAEAEAARQRSVGRRRAPAPVMSVGDDGGEAAPLMGAIQAATAAVEAGLVERGCEARLLLLALVGGEHLLLLGPPGTAKSEVCRRLGKAARLSYFERTLTRFSTPEELFGPLSLAALERDEYKRATDGYAPKAELLFLDEAFKANSAILNSLLTLLNERLFDDGAARVTAPLRTAVAASNELPDSDELDALYDRFLLRRVVRPVSDDGVLEMLLDTTAPPAHADDGGDAAAADLAALLDGGFERRARAVEVPRFVALLLRDARAFVAGGCDADADADAAGGGGGDDGALAGGYVSDRRLLRVRRLLQACAAAHGRGAVDAVDCAAVLPHTLWSEPAEVPRLAEWVEGAVVPDGGAAQLRYLLDSLADRLEDFVGSLEDEGTAAGEEAGAIAAEAEALAEAAEAAAAEMRGHAAAVAGSASHLFLERDAAIRLKQRLAPICAEREAALGEVAAAAAAMRDALRDGDVAAALRHAAAAGGAAGGGAAGGAAGGGAAAAAAEVAEGVGFSDEELAWGRKEAKARLEPEAFKAWRKETKALAKKAK